MIAVLAECRKWICKDIAIPGRAKGLSDAQWERDCHLFTLSTDIYNVSNVLNLVNSGERVTKKIIKSLPSWGL